jgi:hypothetical protein
MKKYSNDMPEEAPQTQFIVKDTASALKIKREERKEAEKRYKAVVAKSKEETKLELAKMKLQMSARESASKHIAVFGPLYLLILVGAFLYAVQYIPQSEISVVSSILTLEGLGRWGPRSGAKSSGGKSPKSFVDKHLRT